MGTRIPTVLPDDGPAAGERLNNLASGTYQGPGSPRSLIPRVGSAVPTKEL